MLRAQVDEFMQWALPISGSLSFTFPASSHLAVELRGLFFFLFHLCWTIWELQFQLHELFVDWGTIRAAWLWWRISFLLVFSFRRQDAHLRRIPRMLWGVFPCFGTSVFLSFTIYWVCSCQICLQRTNTSLRRQTKSFYPLLNIWDSFCLVSPLTASWLYITTFAYACCCTYCFGKLCLWVYVSNFNRGKSCFFILLKLSS